MSEQELISELTIIDEPRLMTAREKAIVKECLAIINKTEKQAYDAGWKEGINATVDGMEDWR